MREKIRILSINDRPEGGVSTVLHVGNEGGPRANAAAALSSKDQQRIEKMAQDKGIPLSEALSFYIGGLFDW